MNEQETSTNTEQVGQSSSAAQLFGGGDGDTTQTGQPNDAGQQQTQQAATPAQPPPPATSFTPEQLREIVASTAREAVTAAQPQPQLTQEQVNKLLNVYRVDRPHAQRLLKALRLQVDDESALDEVAQLLEEITEGKSRQAVTMAAVQLEALRRGELNNIQNQLKPVLTFAQQQQEAQLRKEFMEKYPDMAGWEPMLEMVYQQLLTEKATFADKQSAFKAVYDRAKATLAKLPNAQGNNNNGQTVQRQPNGQFAKMSTVSTGGQMGAGAKTATTGREKLARTLFGNS